MIMPVFIFGLVRNYLAKLVKKLAKALFAFTMYFFTIFYNYQMSTKKKELFASMKNHLKNVEGNVLEIGVGTGANFQFYPRGTFITALDPNPHMNYYLRHSKSYYPHIALKDYIVGSAEDMRCIPDKSMSAVVSTLVLCSVESVEKVLKEIIRVLKPVSM